MSTWRNHLFNYARRAHYFNEDSYKNKQANKQTKHATRNWWRLRINGILVVSELTSLAMLLKASSSAENRSLRGARFRPEPCVPMLLLWLKPHQCRVKSGNTRELEADGPAKKQNRRKQVNFKQFSKKGQVLEKWVICKTSTSFSSPAKTVSHVWPAAVLDKQMWLTWTSGGTTATQQISI